ncbi:DUF2795 domain-containing protein [Melittangium boletus]|uniref:DUF2795 domain-containing protein n=1 Tax=Melittangium boletus TaxID=83453 RepID=UPI001FE4CCD3|nr:DUF2795 domain-containing protein [Melittangium boletus]
MSDDDMKPTSPDELADDAALTQALNGAVFPLSCRQLVWLARENDAPAPLLSRLSALASGSFDSLASVRTALEPQVRGAERAVDTLPSSPSHR